MGTPLVPPSNVRRPDSPSSSSKISPSHSVTFLPTPRPRKSFSGNTYKKQGGGGPALRIRQGCASCVRQRRRSRRILLRPHSFILQCTKTASQFLTAKQFRTLSQNCRGVAQQFPFWELLAEHNAERPLFSSSPFNNLHTLPSSVSHKSFACHSYENCRVYTNNFHPGTRCSILLICCPSCSRIVRASIALRMGDLGPATSRRN